MLFSVRCLDKPNHTSVRAENRNAHIAYLEANLEHVELAGPLLSEDGATMIGSLLIFEFPDRKALDGFLAEDPYAKAGLFETIEIAPFRKVFPSS